MKDYEIKVAGKIGHVLHIKGDNATNDQSGQLEIDSSRNVRHP